MTAHRLRACIAHVTTHKIKRTDHRHAKHHQKRFSNADKQYKHATGTLQAGNDYGTFSRAHVCTRAAGAAARMSLRGEIALTVELHTALVAGLFAHGIIRISLRTVILQCLLSKQSVRVTETEIGRMNTPSIRTQ